MPIKFGLAGSDQPYQGCGQSSERDHHDERRTQDDGDGGDHQPARAGVESQ